MRVYFIKVSWKQRKSSFVTINRLLTLPCSEEVECQDETGIKLECIIKDPNYQTLHLKL